MAHNHQQIPTNQAMKVAQIPQMQAIQVPDEVVIAQQAQHQPQAQQTQQQQQVAMVQYL